jgi:hypothetical protein
MQNKTAWLVGLRETSLCAGAGPLWHAQKILSNHVRKKCTFAGFLKITFYFRYDQYHTA